MGSLDGSVIEHVELRVFSFPMENVEAWSDMPGARSERIRFAVRIASRDGAVGEYVGGNDTAWGQVRQVAYALPGTPGHEREGFYARMKTSLRKTDRMGHGLFDCALWDWAGKRAGVSVSKMLGGFRDRVTAYASTWHGRDGGGLATPSDYVAFAEECADMGYRGFKMHGWQDSRPEAEAETVRALGHALGGRIALMSDPGCHLKTFADVLHVARACDDAGFLWLEDPGGDGGLAAHGAAKLRSLVRTPLLLGEHVRGPESMANLILAGGTDFVRADPDYDMGISGVMKIAHLAEALGLDVELHAPGPAQRACISAIRNTNFYELSMVGPNRGSFTGDLATCGYSDELESVAPDGTFPVPEGPGLGVDWDWKRIEAGTLEVHCFRL